VGGADCEEGGGFFGEDDGGVMSDFNLHYQTFPSPSVCEFYF
jgi:hypothetical protein